MLTKSGEASGNGEIVVHSVEEAVEEAKQFITGFVQLFFRDKPAVFLPYQQDSQPKS